VSTVRGQLLKIIRKISPYTADGAEVTNDNFNSVEPESVTKQRVLDAYNDARKALFQAISSKYREPYLGEVMKELVHTQAPLTFSSGVLSKSGLDGYIKFKSLYNTTRSANMEYLPLEMENLVSSGRNPKYTASVSNMFVFESGEQLRQYGGAATDSYSLKYYKLDDYTMNDIADDEVYNRIYHPMLVTLTELILSGDGQQDPVALARGLIGDGN
jgi:hypothetical protein